MLRNLFFFVLGVVFLDFVRNTIGSENYDRHRADLFKFERDNIIEGLRNIFPALSEWELLEIEKGMKGIQPEDVQIIEGHTVYTYTGQQIENVAKEVKQVTVRRQ